MSDVPVAQPTLLLVDNEANILSALRRLRRPGGYRILTAESGAEGLALIAAEAVDLVISDMRMPVMDGAAFLARVREIAPDTLRILLTGYADIQATVAAINEGQIYRYVSEPWNDQELRLTVALKGTGLAHQQLRQSYLATVRVCSELIESRSSIFDQALIEQLKRIERSEGHPLVLHIRALKMEAA